MSPPSHRLLMTLNIDHTMEPIPAIANSDDDRNPHLRRHSLLHRSRSLSRGGFATDGTSSPPPLGQQSSV